MLYFLFNFSYDDVIGIDVLVIGEMEFEVIIVDFFFKMRIRNGSNLFVIDVEIGDVLIYDDSEDL